MLMIKALIEPPNRADAGYWLYQWELETLAALAATLSLCAAKTKKKATRAAAR